MRVLLLSASLALLSSAACSSDDETPPAGGTSTATATIEAKSGNTTLAGTATFVRQNDETTLTLNVTGAPPGEHGAHIHETGDCSAADAASAGGHWNPMMHDHGMPSAAVSHLGDLGNLTVKADGTGTLTIKKAEWTIEDGGDHDVMDKAIVIHEKVDDFGQPTGNAGGRIGCGVIDESTTPN
jgi:Cu-Zn family superoxide dismutase